MMFRKICFMAVLCSVVFLVTSSGLFGQEQPAAPVPQATLDNLLNAYNGESNAHARYLAFAQKADEEGYGKVASLFRAAARAEQVHYESHAKAIKELGGTPTAKIETPVVKTTKENLEAAVKGETYESVAMYPAFLAQAKKDNVKSAIISFTRAKAAEAVHAALYRSALGNLNAWKSPNKEFFVCPVCGYVTEKIVGPLCPICKTPTKLFMPVR